MCAWWWVGGDTGSEFIAPSVQYWSDFQYAVDTQYNFDATLPAKIIVSENSTGIIIAVFRDGRARVEMLKIQWARA